MTTLLLALAAVVLGSGGQILQRLGARDAPVAVLSAGDPALWLHLLTQPGIVAGLFCWVISTLIWLYLLASVQVSALYGLGSLSYLLVPLAARLLLDEPVTAVQWTSMAIIAVGVAVGRLDAGGR